MLIPLDQDVGLTTISLSIVYFFYKQRINKQSSQSILYFSCIKNQLDHTTLIIKKYFSKFIHILDDIDFSKSFFDSPEYISLFNQVMEICYKKKKIHELILIKGIKKNQNINSAKINYDLSQNLDAEIIFIANLNNNSKQCIKNKEEEIHFFLRQYRYKNVLGIIFNKINNPFFLERTNSLIKKLMILKEFNKTTKQIEISKKNFTDDFLSVIACIPWNRNIIQINILDIFYFLNIEYIYLIKNKNHIIEEIIIFDESSENMLKKKYLNTLVIVSFSRIDNFINIIKLLDLKNNNICCVIFTGAFDSKKNIILLCRLLIKKSISVFFTKKYTIDILSKLQNFNYNITFKDDLYIKKLQKFISSFFDFSNIFFINKNNNYIKTYSPKEFCYRLKILSQKKNKRIILPESYDVRILRAVSICNTDNIAQCVLLGDSQKIYQIACNNNINLHKNVEIINPSLIKRKYVSRLLEIRKDKSLDQLTAEKQIENNIFLATLILEANQVDGLVAGAINKTSDTIRPALQIIKTHPNNFLVSSIFFMLLPNTVLIYSDCGINIDPNSEELAEIAIQSAESSKIFGIEPRIAMLSYSTGYSGSGSQVEKIRKATKIVKNKRPDLIIDGPIQYDAAISESIRKLKAPYSPIVGSANVFIFPDLNSGNIAYKAVQRSANIMSIGPILQGLRKPVNDLSRGASVEEIIYTIALTSIQSE